MSATDSGTGVPPDESQAGTSLELAIRQGVRTGSPVGVDGDIDESHDWGPDRTVSGAFISQLLTDAREDDAKGLSLHGLRISGSLDVAYRDIPCPVLFSNCYFEMPLRLSEAQLPNLRVIGCIIPGLFAEQLTSRGNVDLRDTRSSGPVRLLGARIGGQASFRGASLDCGEGPFALDCDGMTVASDMFCNGGFTARGEVRMIGAEVGGQCDFATGSLQNADGIAFNADGLNVQHDLFFDNGFSANGEVRLMGARIAGQLAMHGAKLSNPGNRALSCDTLQVDQGVLCEGGFSTEGSVRLVGAHLGLLSFRESRLDGAGLAALDADHLTVDQSVFCDYGFTAVGEIGLRSASIGGMLSLRNAKLINPDGEAFTGVGLSVGHSLTGDEATVVKGRMNLSNASVGGDVVLTGSTFDSARLQALLADHLEIRDRFLCDGGFSANGQIQAQGIRVGGEITFAGAQLTSDTGTALDLDRARTPQLNLCLAPGTTGSVKVHNARADYLYDEPDRWPSGSVIAGFVYERLEQSSSVESRLDWLRRLDGDYQPHIFDQLVSFYRRVGREEDARTVAIAKHQQRRRRLRGPARWWDAFLDITVAYGFRTWRAAYWLGGVILVGWLAFARASPEHLRATRNENQLPDFDPLLYSIDSVLPVISLGQESARVPTDAALYWHSFSVLAGWVLATALVAALTAQLTRER